MTTIVQDAEALKQPCVEFDFSNPPFDPIEFAKTLADAMYEHKGLGLAANQIGVQYRAFAMRGEPTYVMYNPRIVDQSSEEVLLEEGCLSFPGLTVKIKRPKSIKVRYTLPNGQTETKTYTGITARVILHEIDHLNGHLFYDRANRYHRDTAFRKWRKSKNGI